MKFPAVCIKCEASIEIELDCDPGLAIGIAAMMKRPGVNLMCDTCGEKERRRHEHCDG
jgi:hypothetical protein